MSALCQKRTRQGAQKRNGPELVEAALNHLPPKLIRTYDRNTYAAEKRDARDKWAAHLKIVVAQATGANVTALRERDSAAGKKR
jgi:hypothetical protein